MAQDPPTLVYDGECGICRYWVTYWQELTEDRVIYRAYQEAGQYRLKGTRHRVVLLEEL